MAWRAEQRAEEELRSRLYARRAEIEEALLTRVLAVSFGGDPDPACAEGLRAALPAALEHSVCELEPGGEEPPPPPFELLALARLAARSEVGLEDVLRGCVGGYGLLVDVFIAEGADLGPEALKRSLRALAALFDRLLAVLATEHRQEAERLRRSTEDREARQVERLLAGELVDTANLDYGFDGHHLAVVARGAGAGEAIRSLADRLDCRVLSIARGEGEVWAWFGSPDPIDPKPLWEGGERHPKVTALALGEPGKGIGGWRRTHRQALAGLPVALREEKRVVRYGDVALLASALRDDLLISSLRALYSIPSQPNATGDRWLGRRCAPTSTPIATSLRRRHCCASSATPSAGAWG